MKKIATLTFIFATTMLLQAQDLMNKDSLLKLLPKVKNDTNAVLLFIKIGSQYEMNQPEMAKSYYLKARDLSKEINYTAGILKFIFNYTYVLNMQNQYDSALILNLKGVKIARHLNDPIQLAKILYNTGLTYTYLEDYENAVKYYEEGKDIFEKSTNEKLKAQAYDILEHQYYQMRNFQKAIELEEKAISIFRKINDPELLGNALTNLGSCYSAIGRLDKSKTFYDESLAIGLKINDKNMQVSQYLNLGDYWIHKGEYEQIKPLMDKALPLTRELQLAESEAIALISLSVYYTYKKDYAQAESYGKKALSVTLQNNIKQERVEVLDHLSKLAYAMQNMRLGDYYAHLGSQLEDSILNQTIQKNTINLEKKYETEKKETKIQHLLSEEKIQTLSNQRKKILLYILTGGILALSAIILLLYWNYNQKQKLQQQKITELETEKQLAATEAVLKGEEQERTRIAKDLHDGLGGMLSGIKYSFTSMKENLVMTPDNHQAFERSMDMLDSSIKEMRRVAHNMMPETLVKFGLDTALKDLCNDINKSGALKVNYQSIGMTGVVIDQTISITVYRIVQELLNNTMKHAGATMSIVQVTKSNDQLTITVEDDGKGFDTHMLNENKGMGWANIRNRVEFVKGKLSVNSQTGEGTSVLIELNI